MKFEIVPDTERPDLRLRGRQGSQWDEVIHAMEAGQTVKVDGLKNANSLNNLRDLWKRRNPERKMHAAMRNGGTEAIVWAE